MHISPFAAGQCRIRSGETVWSSFSVALLTKMNSTGTMHLTRPLSVSSGTMPCQYFVEAVEEPCFALPGLFQHNGCTQQALVHREAVDLLKVPSGLSQQGTARVESSFIALTVTHRGKWRQADQVKAIRIAPGGWRYEAVAALCAC
jgi:hypothetical protein